MPSSFIYLYTKWVDVFKFAKHGSITAIKNADVSHTRRHLFNHFYVISFDICEKRSILSIIGGEKEALAMTVTATEFKTNLGKYLEIVMDEDILITKSGKVIAQLSRPQVNKLAALRNLVGIVDAGGDTTLDAIKDERLKRQ